MRKVFFILLLVAPFVISAQNTWEKKAAFGNDKRSRTVSFSIGNRGYVGCGEDTADFVRNDFWEYDPGTDTWMQKASLPGVGRRDAVGFAIGTKGYVGTGIDAAESAFGYNLNDWWEFNPVTNTWTARATFPGGAAYGGIYFGTGFTVNGMGYIVGGKLGNSQYTPQLWQFNPTTNTWLQRANFTGGSRYSMSAFSINGKGYAGLGTDEDFLMNDWWEYNPTSNTWLQKSGFPGTGRFAARGFAIGSKGYIVGGADGGYKDELWQYDAISDTWWVKAPFDGGERRSVAVFVIANAAYAGTGSGFTGKRRDFWQYEQHLTGVEEQEYTSPGIYPNPVAEYFTVKVPEGFTVFPENTLLSIFSSDGKIILQQEVQGESQLCVNASAFANGVYILQLSGENWHSQSTFTKQ